MRQWLIQGGLCVALFAPVAIATAADRNLAPDFKQLPSGAKVVVMPVDVELFSMTAGGVLEPRADWTASAQSHIKAALTDNAPKFGVETTHLSEQDADEFAEQISLHAAVAESIALHHGFGGGWALPSKNNQLNWSFDDAMRSIQAKTGARYGLFSRVRDSYASAERKATMVAMAILGVGVSGGVQIGRATLVDLETGKVLWFNQLIRGTGDLREAAPAAESVEALLTGFPKAQ